MYQLDTLVKDDGVRVGPTLFPVVVASNGQGVSPAKFYLFKSPDEEDPHWVAAAWRGSMNGGDPEVVFAERVKEFHTLSMRRVDLVTDTGERIIVTPVGGCGCGSRLKSFKPFGKNVRSDQVPGPAS